MVSGEFARAQGVYQINGTLEYRAYNPDQELAYRREASFSIVHGAPAWKVTAEPRIEQSGSTTATVERYEYAYRTNTLQKAIFFQKRISATNAVTKNITVDKGEFVYMDGSLITPVWLAYLSSNYFSKLTTPECPPVWSIPQSFKDRFFVPYRLIPTPAGRVGGQIEFLSPSKIPMDEPNGAVIFVEPPKNLGRYTNAVLVISAYTNWNGHKIPSASTLTTYSHYVSDQGGTPRTFRASEFILSTTSVVEAHEALLHVGGPNQRTYITDYRIGGKAPVTYVATNVLGLKEPKLLALARSQESKSNNIDRPRMAFWAACCLSFFLIGYSAYALKFRRGRTH